MGEIEYGLRFFREGQEIRLLQISGGGRLRLSRKDGHGTKEWWSKNPAGAAWEVYVATEGETWPTIEAAKAVAINLTDASGDRTARPTTTN